MFLEILKLKTVCIVGLSRDPVKASFDVAQYLQKNGYRIVPVNPNADEILGEKVYHSLKEIPIDIAHKIQVLDVFRPSVDAGEVVKEALALRKYFKNLKAVWLQLGIENEAAREICNRAGWLFVQNRCMKIEHEKAKAEKENN